MKKFKFFKRKTSGNIARERLKQLLLNDRMNLSTDLTERIHKDLTRCISRYLEIDEKMITVDFEKDSRTEQTFIKASIPVISLKQRR